MLSRQIESLIDEYVSGAIPASAFAERFAGLYFTVRQARNPGTAAARLCDAVIGPLAEFSRGHRPEESLRQDLKNAARQLAAS